MGLMSSQNDRFMMVALGVPQCHGNCWEDIPDDESTEVNVSDSMKDLVKQMKNLQARYSRNHHKGRKRMKKNSPH